MTKDNIIHFPVEVHATYEALTKAVAAGEYEEGIRYAELLLHREKPTDELVEVYCICLVKIGAYDDVIDLALDLTDEEIGYTACFPYYMQALYERGKYRELMDVYEASDEFLHTIDNTFYYDLAYEMNQKRIEQQMKQYHRANQSGDHQRAYRAMAQMIEAEKEPTTYMKEQLLQSTVHPLVKTQIALFYKETGIETSIEIEKFHQTASFDCKTLREITKQEAYQTISQTFEKMAQENPSFHQMYMQLTHHYFTVMYPFTIDKEQMKNFLQAVERLVANLHGVPMRKLDETVRLEDEQIIQELMKQLQFCTDIYLSIHEG